MRADDPGLTGHGGLVVIGDLAEKLDLTLIDEELSRERRARPVKTRRRGASPGELVVSLAECQLIGGAWSARPVHADALNFAKKSARAKM